MSQKSILIKGAREHNLKNIDLEIPRNKMVVITGLSGSGKSSLAFDTIYAEGQRRYAESLSAYARQFLEQMQKPDVDYIEGLSPTVSVEQRSSSANPRSTVGTSTEIYDYMRLLFARVGQPHCYKCGKPITSQSPQQIVDQIMEYPDGTRIIICAPLIRGRKGEHKDVFAGIKREGFLRVRVDGEVYNIDEVPALAKNKKHEIDIVIDRLIVKGDMRLRLTDSVETALKFGDGIVNAIVQENAHAKVKVFSQNLACPSCGISYEALLPRMFSFNSPYGACPTCDGLGNKLELDADLIIPDREKSLQDGAVEAWRKGGKMLNKYHFYLLHDFCENFDINQTIPFNKLPEDMQRILLFGTTKEDKTKYGAEFEGVIPNLQRRFLKTTSQYIKNRIHQYMSVLPCPECKGARLRKESLAVKLGGLSINQVTAFSILEAKKFFNNLKLSVEEGAIAQQILKEIRERLNFLINVGVGYLTLDRSSGTLSGGEAQRIRLASQIGSKLVGVTYVLDEPTIGLHQKDNEKLLQTLKKLRDLGNSVLIVEHDEEVIREAEYIIDLGPGAGIHGGEVIAKGELKEIYENKHSLTGQYLSGELFISVPQSRRKVDLKHAITIHGAKENNLKNIDVTFPLGVFVAITGVSGSGKSTLINDILYKALSRLVQKARSKPGLHDFISGAESIDKIIEISQEPIGRTPRSNPATYTGVLDEIRNILAQVPEAKARGYKPGRFSFNLKGGRCQHCEGQGTKKIEMHFLPDVYVICEECKGTRYNRETLEIKYRGKNVAEILDMTVEEAYMFFKNFPALKEMLRTLLDVGLGYIRLGQSSNTLSGGEAQRIKLSYELSKSSTGRTLYILDEPTTGLHFDDVHKLLDVLKRLVDLGNTIVIIEHNLDVIKNADYIIDLGPDGGEKGGNVVASGSPEELIQHPTSYTGQFLKKQLERDAKLAEPDDTPAG